MTKISIFIKITFFFVLILFSNNIFAKKAAIIIDFDTQETLFEVNADTLNFPASLTKIMTLYIVFDYLKKNKISWNTEMIVSRIAASRSCSCIDVKEGDKISIEDAVMALIVKSANNVATVISEHISGSEGNFAKLMTSYAKDMGMGNTNFKNASGLPNRAQRTTARDISILSYKIIKNFPNEYKLFKTEKFVWKKKTYKTHNHLMKTYKGADGIKTGYIRASGFQLAFSAIKNNKRLIGIYFGGDTGKQRDQSLSFLMNKEFKELNINQTKIIIKKKIPKVKNKKYKIVVGTFKYKKNAEKHLKLIISKYPKTTKNKLAEVSLIKNNGKQLYESRFQFFTEKDAKIACNRLKKYKRDCFIRG
jgi:D-alanyl-D-alanine carboxypeptidase